jgi:thiamine biosynthesis lipoprotein ApbE
MDFGPNGPDARHLARKPTNKEIKAENQKQTHRNKLAKKRDTLMWISQQMYLNLSVPVYPVLE